jgi:hypothetical protein
MESWMVRVRPGVIGIVLVLVAITGVANAEPGKLTAPLYPGAITLDKEQDCKEASKWYGSSCIQFSRDPVDKVKAFYDQKVGAKSFTLNESTKVKISHFAPFAWEYVIGEMGIGDEFNGVRITERP